MQINTTLASDPASKSYDISSARSKNTQQDVPSNLFSRIVTSTASRPHLHEYSSRAECLAPVHQACGLIRIKKLGPLQTPARSPPHLQLLDLLFSASGQLLRISSVGL